jgi:hypothetical protein
VSSSDISDMLFVRSCMVELSKLSRIYKFKQNSSADPQRLVEVEVLLAKILCFIFDIEYSQDLDYSKLSENSQPVNSRQKIIKDLNVIELLMELIHYPFKNELYDKQFVHKSIYAKDLIQLCYSSIRSSIMEYRPNELYASQWLNLLIEYSLSSLDDSLGANNTLTELIDNNERILEAQIKKDTVEKFVYNLIESKGDKKYIEILRAICICNNKPILKNQKMLSAIILKDNSNRRNLLPELKMDKSEVLIKSPWGKNAGADEWISFANLREESQRMDDLRYYNFFSSLIYLLGNLCLDRNYTAIDSLKEYISLEICIEIICSTEYSWSLRSAFCMLTTNLWIDSFPFMHIQFPDNIKMWNSSFESTAFTSKQNQGELSKFKLLTIFILDFMSNLKNESRTMFKKNFEEYSGFLVSIILMSKKMILLGFFTEYSNFVTIYDALIEILIATDEIISKGNKPTNSSEASAILLKEEEITTCCTDIKIKVCQLLKLFSLIKTDQRAVNLIGLYKDHKTNKDARLPSKNKQQKRASVDSR